MSVSAKRVASRYAAVLGKRIPKKIKIYGTEKVVELTPQQLQALRCVPGGSGLKFDVSHGALYSVRWEKRRGYAHSIEKKFRECIRASGFHLFDEKSNAHPADFFTNSTGIYQDSEGNKISWHSHFGQVAYENSFSVGLTFKHPPPVLSEEAAAERQQHEIMSQAQAVIQSVLSSVKGVTIQKNQFSGYGMSGILDISLLPEWAEDLEFPEWNTHAKTINVNPEAGEVVVGVSWPTKDFKFVNFTEKYDIQDAHSLIAAIGKALRDLKNMKRPAGV